MARRKGLLAGGAVSLTVLLLHLLVFSKLDVADDAYFSSALDSRTTLEFLRFRYERWTGRIPIEFALVSIINHVWFWKLANTAVFLSLCHSIGRLGGRTHWTGGQGIAIAFIAILLMEPSTLWEGAWWLTGSLNYLWPAALAAYALRTFLSPRPVPVPQLLVGVVCAGLAAYSEQVAFFLLGVMVPIAAVRLRKGEAGLRDGLFVLCVLVNVGIALGAPGTVNRYQAEQATWFVNFETLGVAEKVHIGQGLIVRAVFGARNGLVLLVAALAAGLLVRSPVSRLTKISIWTGLLMVVGYQAANMLLPAGMLLRIEVLSPASAASPRVYLTMVVALYATACLVSGCVIALARDGVPQALLTGWVIVVGMASLAALGWSPTAFASGNRTAFVFMLALAFAACRLIVECGSRYGARVSWAVLLLAGTVVAVRTLSLFANTGG